MGIRGSSGKKLTVPSCRESIGGWKNPYSIGTISDKVVNEYTGLNFEEIGQLNIFVYWQYLRDAVIYNHSTTDEGHEYLDKCWSAEQKNPDREKLRAAFNR